MVRRENAPTLPVSAFFTKSIAGRGKFTRRRELNLRIANHLNRTVDENPASRARRQARQDRTRRADRATDLKALEAFRTAAGNFVKDIGGRGDVQEAWRALPPHLQRWGIEIADDLGMAEDLMALGQEPG